MSITLFADDNACVMRREAFGVRIVKSSQASPLSTPSGLGRLTSFSSCPSSSSELTRLVRDLSLKLELTLSNDSLVMRSSLVDAAIGRAVRIDVRELLAGDELYQLGNALDPPTDVGGTSLAAEELTLL